MLQFRIKLYPELHGFKEYLDWAPESMNITYIGLFEPLSKLLVSRVITPIVVPYIIHHITPFFGV